MAQGPQRKGEMMKVWCFILLLSWFTLQLDANPGLKVRITQKGLDFGKEIGMEILKERIKEESFPDWNDSEKFGLSEINYLLSGIRIDTIEFRNTAISLIPGTGIKLTIENAYVIIKANWNIRSWMFKGSGRTTVVISGLSITAMLVMSMDSTGHPSISLDSCQMIASGVEVKLHGKNSWFYNMFTKFLKKSIHRILDSNSCPNLRQEIEIIDMELRILQILIQIDDFAQIDYSLVKSPAVFQSYIDLDLQGTTYPVGNYPAHPYVPVPFALQDSSDSMLYLAVSEYSFQTTVFAYYTTGAFNIIITDEVCSYFNITTETFGSIIPEVAQYYAESQPVMLNLTATKTPVISLQTDAFTIEIHGSMEVLAVLPDATTQSLFTVNITTNSSINLTLFDQKLIGSLCLNRFQLSLADSNLGFFEISLLENFFSYILHSEIIPSANAKLTKGFPLPNLANISLKKPFIKVEQGYLWISADVNYEQ
ncbi:BPI fold-containing family C protein isoform X1 [Alligator mississippiensis]|uniref:BPI fold-containing family C protein isoform X1 n=2 Tax=Alligator mississippiensis TaxID=8496 RepID=UPI00287769C3|nr:BPI fold-containing family C protein isoform X1 [Alligator mississippiensis]